MADLTTQTIPFTRKPKESINHKILNILKVPLSIPQVLRSILESAAEAFENKSYKKSAKYFKNALDNMSDMNEMGHEETITLTKYMLCMCWLESDSAKDLLEALKILEELEKEFGYAYPMIYYAVGKTYFKLYRFSKADDALKKGFALLNRPIEVNEYKIPGTNIVIQESSMDRLLSALVKLNDQCSSWHRPDAICCMPDCSNYSQNEGADKMIFFGSPTFIGMVQVSCNNTSSVCTVSFHMACWKAKKENLSSVRKLSDKDLLHWECFTPNCEDQGVRCTIKKIEIFDENAEIKATIRADEIVKHTKVQPAVPKGAIRKQQHQQQPKAKVTSNEPRVPIERHPRPTNVSHEVNKIDEADIDDDIHDEQALKSSVEKLKELRAKNFGIENENIWRPNLSMYGKVFMLETEDAFPDPDFSDEDPEVESLRAFAFTYFYEFVLNNGPIKLDALAEKWNETQHMINNIQLILKKFSDITEFLLQSVKFAVVGDYICVAKKLPEAYELAKRNACETIRFFMDNDIDQRSNSSSVDDEAFFNDILKQEKNNNSLSYSSTSEDSKFNTEDSNSVTDETIIKKKKMSETVGESTDVIDQPPQHETPLQKQKTLPEIGITAQVNGNTESLNSPMKSISSHEKAEIEAAVTKQLSEVSSILNIVTAVKKNIDNVRLPSDSVDNELNNCKEQKEVDNTNENEKMDCSLPRVNGSHHLHEIENQLNFSFKPKIAEDTFVKESKSVGDIDGHITVIREVHGGMNSEEPATRSDEMNVPSPISQNDTIISEEFLTDCETSAPKSHEILVGELLEEVQRLSSKLSICEIYKAQLETEIALLYHREVFAILSQSSQNLREMKTHAQELPQGSLQRNQKEAAERVKLLQRNLQYQYAYNHSLIIRKLEECQRNFETLWNIQKLLMNTTGSTLVINEAEYQKVMAEIEKISKKHQTKYWELREKLESTTDLENLTEVNIEAEKLPNLPAMEMSNVIQYAITMYRMQQDYKRAEIMQTPYPRNPPPLFASPGFKPNFVHNNPPTVFPPQFNPNNQLPLGVHPPSLTALPKNIDLLAPPRPVPTVIPQNPPNPSNSSQQHIPSLFRQLIAFPSTTMNAVTGQPIFSLPRDQISSNRQSSAYLKQNNSMQQHNRRNYSKMMPDYNQQNGAGPVATSTLVTQKNEPFNEHFNTGNNRPSSVMSGSSDNSKDHYDIRDSENVTNYEHEKTKNIVKADNDDSSSIKTKENTTKKKNYKSIDKVMQALRNRYVGVLEFDLVKSLEAVRKNHDNSLTGMTLGQIIREASKAIMERQQKQLCGYEKRRLPQFSAAFHSSTGNMQKDERKQETSMPHSTSVKKEPGRTWEPVVIPNDTWHKESVESECVMCLDPIANAEPYTLQCKHTFHKACLKNWFSQSQSCPTCRVHSTIDDEFPPLS